MAPVDLRGMSGFLSTLATGLLGFGFPFFGGPSTTPRAQPATPAKPKVVAAPIASAASGPIRGTFVLIHGGGWTGPDETGQRALVQQPGQLLIDRGWRVVSVDYAAGQAGLDNVVNEIGAELTKPTGGLLCLYGESSGGHLALLAAARIPSVDCVVAAGAPTNLVHYVAEARGSGDAYRKKVADVITATFGEPGPETASWEPAKVAGQIDGDVMIVQQEDDVLVPAEQVNALQHSQPTAKVAKLAAGDQGVSSDHWLHGTLSPEGRGAYLSAMSSFADRAVRERRTERSAAALRCKSANEALARIGATTMRAALRCLAKRDRMASRRAGSRRRSLRLTGQVTAARIWAALRSTAPGRRTLGDLARGRVSPRVTLGETSRVTLR